MHLESDPWHTLGGVWGPSSSRVSPRCGVDRKVALRTDGAPDAPRPRSLLSSGGLRLPRVARPPNSASDRPPGPTREGLVSGKAAEPRLPIRPLGKNPLAAAMFPAPKPAPDTAGRAPGIRRGKTRVVAGTLGLDCDSTGVTTCEKNPPLIHPEAGRRRARRLSNASLQAPPRLATGAVTQGVSAAWEALESGAPPLLRGPERPQASARLL